VPDPARPLPPTDPEVLQRRAYAATRAIVRAEGERPLPAILLVEDLQWLDPASDAFVAQMIEAQATCRGLIVVNFRPGYKADWMTGSSYQQLPLVPLGQDAVRELLVDLLGSDASVADLADPIHQRVGGNPFFVEEIVQNLFETGVLEGQKGSYRLHRAAATVTLPDTVHSVLAARIDRLPAREKRLLQQAAVIGKSVPERILKRIANLADADFQPAMRMLREGDFLYEESLYPQVAYAFKHPLSHEVAYRTQLKDRRGQTHASVARIIEELSEDRLGEEAALIAHHWEEAGEKVIAARWHARAARWIGIRDYGQAFAHWRRVADLIGDEGAPDVLALRAEAFHMLPVLAYRTETSDEEEVAFVEQGRRFLERIGDQRSLAAFIVAYAGLRQNACDLRGYERATREALTIAERCGELALGAAVRPDRLWSLYCLGRLLDARAVADEIVVMTGGDAALGADICGFSPYIMSHLLSSVVLSELGHFPEARDRAERAVQLALVRGPDETLCWAHWAHVHVLDAAGECGPAGADAARMSLEAAERSGSPQAFVSAQSAIVAAGKGNGDWSAAMTAAEAALRVSRTKHVARDFEFRILSDYAQALLGAGEIERAVEVATEAAELAQDRGALVHRCRALVVLARCLRERHGISVARQMSNLLDEADRLVDQTGAAYWRPRVLVERAELDRLRGDTESARRVKTLAQRLFAEMGATGYAERIAKELAQ